MAPWFLLRPHFLSPHSGTVATCHHCSQQHEQGAGLEVERPGVELIPVWDAGIADGSLTPLCHDAYSPPQPQPFSFFSNSHCPWTPHVLAPAPLEQSSALALLAFGARYLCLCWLRVQCRVFSSIPGLYPLDASHTHRVLKIRNVSRHQLRTALDVEHDRSLDRDYWEGHF